MAREFSAREAIAALAVMLPMCETGHVIDTALFPPQLAAWVPRFVAVGGRVGDVFLLPAEKGVDDGRYRVLRLGCGTPAAPSLFLATYC